MRLIKALVWCAAASLVVTVMLVGLNNMSPPASSQPMAYWPSEVVYATGESFTGPDASADIQTHYDTLGGSFDEWFNQSVNGGIVDAVMRGIDWYTLSWDDTYTSTAVIFDQPAPPGITGTPAPQAPYPAAMWFRGIITGYNCTGPCALVVQVTDY